MNATRYHAAYQMALMLVATTVIHHTQNSSSFTQLIKIQNYTSANFIKWWLSPPPNLKKINQFAASQFTTTDFRQTNCSTSWQTASVCTQIIFVWQTQKSEHFADKYATVSHSEVQVGVCKHTYTFTYWLEEGGRKVRGCFHIHSFTCILILYSLCECACVCVYVCMQMGNHIYLLNA